METLKGTVVALAMLLGFAAFAKGPRAEDKAPAKLLQWWRLPSIGLVPRDKPVTWTSAEEARKQFARGEETNVKLEALLKAVSFETHSLVLASVEVDGDAEFDVESVTLADGILKVVGVQDVKSKPVDKRTSEVIVLLVSKLDFKVDVSWKTDTLKKLQERRDCPGSHLDTDSCGLCRDCGAKTPTTHCGLCRTHSQAHQECGICGKRVPFEPPLK